jgi:hypothetical protein
MTPPKCEICTTHHYGWQAHTFAINKAKVRLTDAINTAINTDAINREAEGEEVGCPLLRGNEPGGRHADVVRGVDKGSESGVAPGHPGKSANRRSREAYNQYMREYMRKRRER